jgi:phospholipase/carboxylesterase
VPELTHRIRPAEGGPPDGAIVLLHGRGSDEYDLEPLLDVLDPRKRLVGVFPRGPLHLPPGGAHWYVVPRVGYPDPQTFAATVELAGAFLDGVPQLTGVPWERTVLGGFSQGAVMSYALGLGAGRPSPAGIAGLSGFIPTVEGFELDLGSRRGLPVAIAHGSLDPVIDVQFSRTARDLLSAGGLDVTYHEAGYPHTIDPAFLPALHDWIRRALAI